MTTTYLKLEQLNKTFKRANAEKVKGLESIDLEVQKGEIVGIIGTNGAGKSTLFNALTGNIPLDSGRIVLDGKNITKDPANKRASYISRVFQDPNMGTAPRMTVFENLMLAQKRGQRRGLGTSLRASNKAAMATYLSSFKLDLENRLDTPISYLSGGQRQTISLVMATLLMPKLLLLDEHTSALDPRTAKSVMLMTQSIVKENDLTTLMITHRMQDAIDYCDRLIVLHQGRIERVLEQSQLSVIEVGQLYELLEELVTVEESLVNFGK